MPLSVLEAKAKENFDVAESIKDSKRNSAVSSYYYACLLAVKSYLINDGFISESDIRSANSKGTSTHRFLIDHFKKRFKDHPDYPKNHVRFRKLESIKEARVKADYDEITNFNHPSFYADFNKAISDVRVFVNILRTYCSAPF